MYSRGSSTQNMEPFIISFRDTSQYSAGGPSACGLASVNAVRTILTECISGGSIRAELEKEETAMSIMAICQYWHSNEHLDVQDILNLPLFQCQLETVEVEDNQSTMSNFRRLARSLTRGGACAAVVTRAPEIVSIMHIPAQEKKSNGFIVIFDSHPRPEHPLGAAFLVFYTPDDAASYLSKLFQVDAAIMRDDNWQTQMLSRYSAHILQARRFTEDEDIKAVYDANTKLLKTSSAMKEALKREGEIQSEVRELRQKLERQREARQQATSAESAAERKLRDLRRELASAREFAESLSNENPMQPVLAGGSALPVYRVETNLNHHPIDNKGKGRVIDDTKSQPPPPVVRPSIVSLPTVGGSMAQFEPRTSYTGTEADEYERVRQAGLAAKAAEHRRKNQSEQEATKQREKKETERRNSEAADRERQAKIEAEQRSWEFAIRLQMEEEKLLTQQSELMRTADAGFNCQICIEDWSVGMMSRIESCGHAICRDCMTGHIKSELDERRWPVLCSLCRAEPSKNTEPGVITREICEFAGADEDLITKWAEVELATVCVTVSCPTCKKVFPIAKEDYDETDMLPCAAHECDAFWCKTCSQLGERGVKHSCDGQAEFDRWRDGQKDVRSCPGCRTFIVRNKGCRHMTCIAPGCNTHFCDACGKLIIKSRVKGEIDTALQAHYRACTLFDDYN